MAATTVELLYFDGCPNHRAARELVERLAAVTGTELDLRLVEVGSAGAAERLRFLGSPSVRVNGRDVEPGADARESFVLACRVYRTESGFSGLPSEGWVSDALEAS
ncbi:MAG TPA: hypothetical protein VFU51_11485 [Gaiellaceae bacterium]|nr:hypothetical protein [Gaiellaceae bacterium]